MIDTKKVVQRIREKLGHFTMDWKPSVHLDTGSSELNGVLGHPDRGIPYGRIVELSGLESHGKTALAMSIAALAQKEGALVVWLDFESSFDVQWAGVRGLDSEASNFVLIQPYVGTFGKSKKPRMSSAQQLCAETEAIIERLGKKYERVFLCVDSIASMLTEGESDAGLEGQNMRTSMDLPMFLGRLLRRWVGFAQQNNVLLLLINQLRQSPKAYGDPWYTPGGNAVRYYCHARVRIRRVKGGAIRGKGSKGRNTLIGIKSILSNIKNKNGGTERLKVGCKILFKGPLHVLPAEKLEKED